MQQITCPNCKTVYHVKGDVPSGRAVQCKKCGTSFTPSLAEDKLPTGLTAISANARNSNDPDLTKPMMPSSDSSIKQTTPVPRSSGFSGNTMTAQDLTGMEIGGCRIERKLGQGGMGAVYLAHHIALDIPVAIKLLPRHLAESNSSFIERFIREARSAAKLQHQNIVGVLNVGEQDGLHYIVMQYVNGHSLQDILRKEGRLSEPRAMDIIIQVGEALKAAYSHHIIHRDIKPDNIMIDRDGIAKLADLGLAKDTGDSANVTQSGTAMGTPLYMSPEQAEDTKSVDHRSDIYSLGCTFYHMLCGQVPYAGNTVFAILKKHVSEPVPDPQATNPGISGAVASIIRKMMAKAPEDRYQTPAELLADLDRARDGLTPEAARMSAIAEKPPASSKLMPPSRIAAVAPAAAIEEVKKGGQAIRIYAGVAALAVGVAIIAFVLRGKHTAPKTTTGAAAAATSAANQASLFATSGAVVAVKAEAIAKAVELAKGTAQAEAERKIAVADKERAEAEAEAAKAQVALAQAEAEKQRLAAEKARLEAERAKAEAEAALRAAQPASIANHLSPDGEPVRKPMDSRPPLRKFTAEQLHQALRMANPEYDGNARFKLKDGIVVGVDLSASNVRSLVPLMNTSITALDIHGTAIGDIMPLRDTPLTWLDIRNSQVTDLMPLAGLKLDWFIFTPRSILAGIAAVRNMDSITKIGDDPSRMVPPELFWRRFDAIRAANQAAGSHPPSEEKAPPPPARRTH